MAKVEIDPISGTPTTGHEWDGIKELNTPLPKWWILTFYATIIWTFAYWVVYPTIPSWGGIWNYSSREELGTEMAAAKKAQSAWLDKLKKASAEEIAKNPELAKYARKGGEAMFKENCSACHGMNGAGVTGYPSLQDDEWIWGGKIAEIEKTIRVGARSTHKDTRASDMPKFGVDQALKPEEIAVVADYVVALSSGKGVAGKGAEVFADNCAACHGEKGEGNRDVGAPRLNNAIWLYKGDKKSIEAQVNNPRQGVMPTWEGRLNDVTIKQLAVYVHSLGGGEK